MTFQLLLKASNFLVKVGEHDGYLIVQLMTERRI